MPWWEGRTAEDLPEYLKDKFGKVKRVLDYDMEYTTVVFDLDDFHESLAHYTPATSEDWEAQQTKEA